MLTTLADLMAHVPLIPVGYLIAGASGVFVAGFVAGMVVGGLGSRTVIVETHEEHHEAP